MQTLRIGDHPGEHTVYFAALGERLELKHISTSRDSYVRGALGAAIEIFELHITTDSQKLEVRSNEHLAARGFTYTRPHRGAETFDVHANPGTWNRAIRSHLFGLLGTTDGVEQLGAIRVEIREADAEFTAAILLTTPRHLALGDDLAAITIKSAHQRFARLRHVGRPQPNAINRYIDRLRLEAAGGSGANFDERLVRDARCIGIPTVGARIPRVAILYGHLAVLPDPFGRLAE
jgi:hypothetical protein